MKPIYVSQPDLPPLEEFVPYLQKIWENKIVTNNGPCHEQLEQALCDYLDVEHLSLFVNGTIALITALKALRITGEIITTPYSFVASTHSFLWNNNKPIFVDIDPNTCNLDPNRIEEAITPLTTAIMPVHCYGNPCAVEQIQEIADTNKLKVVYDAAHAFAVKYKGGSLLKYGDLSILSFHATKVFHTFEGGAIICKDAETKQYLDHLKNFGFSDELTISTHGVNGKMNEINSSFGLLQLNYIDKVLEKRRQIMEHYRNTLANVRGICLLPLYAETKYNASFLPIFVNEDYPLNRDELYQKLKNEGINGRRYFYPLISNMKMYQDLPSARISNLPIASKVSSQVLCLPIYSNLELEIVDEICRLIAGESH